MKSTDPQLYKTEESGLLIGLVNVPMGTNLSYFFEQEMKESIFLPYRKKIFGEDDAQEKTNFLYKPHAYHLLGEHNLAVLSLVDDFAFAQRVFQASHCFPRKYAPPIEDYMIRTVTGISTYPAEGEPRLLETARHTFLFSDPTNSEKKTETSTPYPFIGIVRYKLNNGLLIGNGQDYLEAVKQRLEKRKENDMALFMIDSFCNNELTLVIFAHDPEKIVKFVTDSRQFTTSSLNETGHLYAHALQGKITGTPQQEFDGLHLFSSSHTLLGFDLDLFTDEAWQNRLQEISFTVKFYWDIKPGHIYNVYKDLEEITGRPEGKKEEGKKKIIVGEASLVYEQKFTLKEYISFVSAWEKRGEKNRNDLRHLRISMEIEIDNEILKQEETQHPFNRLFSRMKIDEKAIRSFHTRLLSLGIPKVLEQRIQKVFGNFNDCITDPLFAIYFMELRHYLFYLDKILHDTQDKGNLAELQKMLNGFIANFEKAYYNRFHHSNRIIGIDDFNLEYNGGIQQLLSGFDAVYKYIAHLFVELPETDSKQPAKDTDRLPPFAHVVCVSGYERVYSDQCRMMINILYMTYPELFAATVWKEAINSFFNDEAIRHLDQLFPNGGFDLFTDQVKEKGFPDYMHQEIRRDPRFNKTAYSHRRLCEAFNVSFLKYVLVDGLVLKCGYAEDFDQLYYWYWKVFLQMNHLMEKTSEKNAIGYPPDNFITMLFRLVYWAYCLDKQDQALGIPSGGRIDKIRYTPFDPALKDLWMLHFNDVYIYVQILYEKLQSIDFNFFIDGVADTLNTQLFPPLIPSETEEDLPPKEKEAKPENREPEAYELYKQKEMLYAELVGKPLEHFRRNEIITYEEEKKTLYISLLLRAYLKQIQALDTTPSDACKGIQPCPRYALRRDPKGQPLHKLNYTNLLSDPYGGIFIFKDPDIRKKYYTLRSVFYKSIWDFSMKSKTEIFPIPKQKE